MEKKKNALLSIVFSGSMILIMFLALVSCDPGTGNDPSTDQEAIGMWEAVILGAPPVAGYQFIYINEDKSLTIYYCITDDGCQTFQFLPENKSSTGVYEIISGGVIQYTVEAEEYDGENDEWVITDVNEVQEVEYNVSGDSLNAFIDLNGDGDYDDDHETNQLQRRDPPLDVNGDGDYED
jgi:hypothetical protein